MTLSFHNAQAVAFRVRAIRMGAMREATAYPLPVEIEAVTPTWLQAALRSSCPELGLRDAELLDIQHGTCTKLRFRLDLDLAGRAAGIPERVIVKG